MKNIFFLLLSCFTFTLNAQDRFQEAANYAANHICNCVNEVYSGIDEDIRSAVVVMTKMGETEAENYIMSLPEEKQMRLMQQSMIMLDESKNAEFDACNESMLMALEQKFTEDFEAMGYTENDFMKALLVSLSKKKSCSFTYFLLQIGLGMEIDPDDNYSKGKNSGKSDENDGNEDSQ